MIQRIIFSTFLFFIFNSLFAQKATVKGVITNKNNNPIALVSISIEGTSKGVATTKTGAYQLKIPANQKVVLVISHTSFKEQKHTLNLKEDEVKELNFLLDQKTKVLEAIDISDDKEVRVEAGKVKVKVKAIKEIPTPFGDFNQGLITGGALGIQSNNELSSSYSVRGGSFDENLVYVNGIQIYRPFLVRAGQQEGLSFVNSEMVKSIEFSSGGWQPKYGDKLSSVLNIEYKTPKKFAASATGGLLGGNVQIEGTLKDKRISYIASVRRKSSKYLLNTLETQGQYLPRFTDIQTYFNFDLSGKGKDPGNTTLGVLLSYARNRYEVVPESRETTFGTFQTPFRIFIGFAGTELLTYDTFQGGLKLRHEFNSKFSSEFIGSGLLTREREYINLESGYRLCDIQNNPGAANFNECIGTRGIGSFFDYSRNALEAQIYAFENRNIYEVSDNWNIEFGLRVSHEEITDKLDEYTFKDSAQIVDVTYKLVSENDLNSNRISAYVQSNHLIGLNQTLTYGVRLNHWDLNGQTLVSPRIQYSIEPNWKADIVFKAALGLYQQPPFFRELRGFDGSINKDLKAQSSVHAILGMDLDFIKWDRQFKFITEVYYKQIDNLIPYDIDNVRLRYYANNDAKAKIYGADFRVSGEFIKGAESWFSLGILSAQEDVEGDERGFIRRPTDQRMTAAIFFQDHLQNNPSVRVNLRYIYGTGLPFGPPNSFEQRAAFKAGTTYNRADIGFSKIISLQDKKGDGYNGIKTIWIGLDILNLFGVSNNISFTWIKDFSNRQYAVPNALSQRFFNLRIKANI